MGGGCCFDCNNRILVGPARVIAACIFFFKKMKQHKSRGPRGGVYTRAQRASRADRNAEMLAWAERSEQHGRRRKRPAGSGGPKKKKQRRTIVVVDALGRRVEVDIPRKRSTKAFRKAVTEKLGSPNPVLLYTTAGRPIKGATLPKTVDTLFALRRAPWPMRAGEPGFQEEATRRLRDIKLPPAVCSSGPKRRFMPYQCTAVFCASPHNVVITQTDEGQPRLEPAIERVLVHMRTGSGKTRVLVATLSNLYESSTPKYVLVPTKELVTNFYMELLNSPNPYRRFIMETKVRAKVKSTGEEVVVLEHYEKDTREDFAENKALVSSGGSSRIVSFKSIELLVSRYQCSVQYWLKQYRSSLDAKADHGTIEKNLSSLIRACTFLLEKKHELRKSGPGFLPSAVRSYVMSKAARPSDPFKFQQKVRGAFVIIDECHTLTSSYIRTDPSLTKESSRKNVNALRELLCKSVDEGGPARVLAMSATMVVNPPSSLADRKKPGADATEMRRLGHVQSESGRGVVCFFGIQDSPTKLFVRRTDELAHVVRVPLTGDKVNHKVRHRVKLPGQLRAYVREQAKQTKQPELEKQFFKGSLSPSQLKQYNTVLSKWYKNTADKARNEGKNSESSQMLEALFKKALVSTSHWQVPNKVSAANAAIVSGCFAAMLEHIAKHTDRRILVLVPELGYSLFCSLMCDRFGRPITTDDRTFRCKYKGSPRARSRLDPGTPWLAIHRKNALGRNPRSAAERREAEDRAGASFTAFKSGTGRCAVGVIDGKFGQSTGVDFRGINELLVVSSSLTNLAMALQTLGRGGRLCDKVDRYGMTVFLPCLAKEPGGLRTVTELHWAGLATLFDSWQEQTRRYFRDVAVDRVVLAERFQATTDHDVTKRRVDPTLKNFSTKERSWLARAYQAVSSTLSSATEAIRTYVNDYRDYQRDKQIETSRMTRRSGKKERPGIGARRVSKLGKRGPTAVLGDDGEWHLV